MLAPRAIESRAGALHDPPDRPAAFAWPPLAIIDREVLREIAELAVRADEVAQGRAARLDRFGEHFTDRRDQPFEPRQRYRPTGSRGVNLRPEKRLAHVDIAESRDDPLVEQQQLDRRLAAGEPALQITRIEVHRLGTQSGERRPFAKRIGPNQVERA